MKKLKNVKSVRNQDGDVFLVNDKDQVFKGAGFTSIYGTIGMEDGSKILSAVAQSKPTGESEVVFGKSKRGFMTLGSILGNGRFRDRGISETLLLKLFTNNKFLKRVRMAYKMTPLNEESLQQVYEPIVDTQSLTSELSQVKKCLDMDENGLTGTVQYDNIRVQVSATEAKRLTNFI